jgi:hypothetical protein
MTSGQQSSPQPVKYRTAKRPCGAATTQEQVPDFISQSCCLCGSLEADPATRAAKGDRKRLALGLAELDVRRERLAVCERSPRERRIVSWVASLRDP